MKYKIIVTQRQPLTFIVDDYEVLSGTLIRFKDREQVFRTYDSRLCEIIEVDR